MPLISLRWYQLAINRAHANACLSGDRQSFQVNSLLICIDAAAELLFSVSVEATTKTGLNYRVPRTSDFSVQGQAASSFRCTVRSFSLRLRHKALTLNSYFSWLLLE